MMYITQLLGGFALFIYGMNQMGKGLELLAGNKLQDILEKLTSNKLLGVLIGTVVTAIIQSSSATTVMTVGFVNSKILTLKQAIYIIMGANIGTTVTGLILTLNVEAIAPLAAFIGMVMMLFMTRRKYKYSGTILFGFGVLFMGMAMMGDAVTPLAENDEFKNILATANNPLLGILMGTLFTAIIQSSSATTGVLITLANNGLLQFSSAFYLVLGTNIGTCFTSVLASLGSNKNAKRVAVSHITFNLIGTIIFSIIAIILPLITFIESWTPMVSQQIAFLHLVFNITTTVLLLPFTNQLEKIANNVIRGQDPRDIGFSLMYLNAQAYHDTIPTIAGIKRETLRMFEYAKKNLLLSISNLIEHDDNKSAEIEFNEEVIDFLNAEITKVNVKTMTNNLSKQQYKQLSYFLKIVSNIERLGDYSYNIYNLSNYMIDNNIQFSNEAKQEIQLIVDNLEVYFDDINESLTTNEFDMKNLRTLAIKIADIAEKNRDESLERLKSGKSNAEEELAYDKLYTYLMRLRDHLQNIQNQYSTIYQ